MSGLSCPRVLVVHPSADRYGSDLQLVETVAAMVQHGWKVIVAVPDSGDLVGILEGCGAEVLVDRFPVLRREYASFRGLARLASEVARTRSRMRRLVTTVQPDLGFVNTATIPWWSLTLRLSGVPVVCHVHEAETEDRWPIRFALNAPLLLADRVIVNSRAARDAVVQIIPKMNARTDLLYNGVPDHDREPTPADFTGRPLRLSTIARISPRKGTDLAIEALALLRESGRDVDLDICGTSFAGYEWFEREVRRRSAEADVAGHVHWLGYVSPVVSVLEHSHIFVAPSRAEPFGNSVVEAQLAARPVVASAVQGHLETIIPGETGMHFESGDAAGLARAVAALMDSPDDAARIGQEARRQAVARFSVDRYRRDIVSLLERVLQRPPGGTPGCMKGRRKEPHGPARRVVRV